MIYNHYLTIIQSNKINMMTQSFYLGLKHLPMAFPLFRFKCGPGVPIWNSEWIFL